MKFETKFGIGEIVHFNPSTKNHRLNDELLKVVGIYIDADKSVRYVCQWPQTGFCASYTENQIKGDPDFNQEAGEYPED